MRPQQQPTMHNPLPLIPLGTQYDIIMQWRYRSLVQPFIGISLAVHV